MWILSFEIEHRGQIGNLELLYTQGFKKMYQRWKVFINEKNYNISFNDDVVYVLVCQMSWKIM